MTEAFFNHSKGGNGVHKWKFQINVELIMHRTAYSAVIPIPYLIKLPNISENNYHTWDQPPWATCYCWMQNKRGKIKWTKTKQNENCGQGAKRVTKQKRLFPDSPHCDPYSSVTMKSLPKRMEMAKPSGMPCWPHKKDSIKLPHM